MRQSPQVSGKGIPNKEMSKCQESEVGMGLEYLRRSKEPSTAQ